MRAFAYLSQGQAGWVEKAPPQATGFDGIIRPLLVSPCTSDAVSYTHLTLPTN